MSQASQARRLRTCCGSRVAKRDEDRQQYIHEVRELVDKGHAGDIGLPGQVYGRPKHLYGIYQKMNKQSISFEEVYDLTALRIVTDTKMNCYALLGVIHSLWRPVPGRFKDYIAIPKSNLYQSSIRRWSVRRASTSNSKSGRKRCIGLPNAGSLRIGNIRNRDRSRDRDSKAFGWLHQFVEWHQDLPDNRQFMDSVKLDLFHDVVYVFTPKGIVKELPKGSTPVDFAYAIHTEVGDHCVGAKVNGKIVPLKHQVDERRYGRNSHVAHANAAQRLVEVCPDLARQDENQTLDQARRTKAEYRNRTPSPGVGIPAARDGAGSDAQVGGAGWRWRGSRATTAPTN